MNRHNACYPPTWGAHEDDPWDVFIADDDQCDPQPEPNDFWLPEDLPFAHGVRGNMTAGLGREVLPCFP
jgi:hypothetical protein